MVALYVFSLVLGGGFLALSVFGDFLGGHGDVDLGVDAGGLDLGAGGVELEVGGLDGDVGVHADAGAAHAALDADAGHVVSKIFSIRTLFYSLFGFGAVGTLLTFVWSGGALLTAGFALVSGAASGALIHAVFGYVQGSESGMVLSESTYAGCQGRVILPIRGNSPGRVVVERGGRRVELRALPHSSSADQGDPATWRSVFVVEMARGVALVAPVEEGMLLEP
jgi:hypothetical protein